MSSRTSPPLAVWVGLMTALVVPFLTYLLLQAIFGGVQSQFRVECGLVLHWLNLLAVVIIVLRLEQRPLSSIGVRPWRWSVPVLGIAFGIVVFLTYPLIAKLNESLGLTSDQGLFAFLASLPFWVRVLAVLTAGIFEETLFRGYALERIAELTGSKWAAAIITLAAFTLMHTPSVGFTHLLPVLIVGFYVTALYLWRRNLVLNMIAHAVIDGIALLIVPALTQTAH